MRNLLLVSKIQNRGYIHQAQGLSTLKLNFVKLPMFRNILLSLSGLQKNAL